MRVTMYPVLVAVVLTLGVFTTTHAEAFGRHHHIHRYAGVDPYGYHYVRPRYYPYYNSGYWRSAAEMRMRRKQRYVHPRYYQSWGYPKPRYRVMKRRWHRR